MNLLHAIPYLFDGELESVTNKAQAISEVDVYAVAHGNVIRFEDVNGNTPFSQGIYRTDFEEEGKKVDWVPNFYEHQSAERREEIQRVWPARYTSSSYLVGIEKLLTGELKHIENEQGVKLRLNTKSGCIDADDPTADLEDLETIFDDYQINRAHLAMDWKWVEE